MKILSRKNRGFTLIELLSVVAICGVLLALILPAINKMRLQGLRAATTNNMRQLGTAIMAYAGEHENRLPGPTSQGLYRGYTRNTTEQLSHMLGPYLGLPEQSEMASGDNIIVPQLTDPGYIRFNPKAPSSVPQYVQKLAYPAWRLDLAGRRPFGATEATNPTLKAPLTFFDLSILPREQQWLLTTVDQQVVGLTASWKNQTPPTPLYGIRLRLYADGSVAPVEADDKN